MRYTSTPLLNSVFLGELEQANDVGMLEQVLSGTLRDSVISEASSPEGSDWDQRDSEIQHWQGLTLLDSATEDDVPSDVDRLEEAIVQSRALYAELQEAGVDFDRMTRGDHLEEWSEAIRTFRTRIDL